MCCMFYKISKMILLIVMKRVLVVELHLRYAASILVTPCKIKKQKIQAKHAILMENSILKKIYFLLPWRCSYQQAQKIKLKKMQK